VDALGSGLEEVDLHQLIGHRAADPDLLVKAKVEW
jgi:hypothetical protein